MARFIVFTAAAFIRVLQTTMPRPCSLQSHSRWFAKAHNDKLATRAIRQRACYYCWPFWRRQLNILFRNVNLSFDWQGLAAPPLKLAFVTALCPQSK
jgi:hypothetical protein